MLAGGGDYRCATVSQQERESKREVCQHSVQHKHSMCKCTLRSQRPALPQLLQPVNSHVDCEDGCCYYSRPQRRENRGDLSNGARPRCGTSRRSPSPCFAAPRLDADRRYSINFSVTSADLSHPCSVPYALGTYTLSVRARTDNTRSPHYAVGSGPGKRSCPQAKPDEQVSMPHKLNLIQNSGTGTG